MKKQEIKNLGLKETIQSTIEVKRDKDSNVYSESIQGLNGKYCRASIGYEFPVHDCLNMFAYDMIVVLWKKKPNFDKIEYGNPHYDFDSVIFHNCPHAGLLFNKWKPKTIAKLYTLKAVDIASN